VSIDPVCEPACEPACELEPRLSRRVKQIKISATKEMPMI